MQTFTLTRLTEDASSTGGQLFDPQGRKITDTVERGAHNPEHPRIVAGTYPLRMKEGGSKFDARYQNRVKGYNGMVEICDVPERSEILIHTANRFQDLEGCVGVGLHMIGQDGNEIVPGSSLPAFASLLPILYAAIGAQGGAQIIVKDIWAA